MISAIIFDLEGVIVKTEDLHYKAWKMMTNKENIPFSRSINHKLRGVSRMESLTIILEHAHKAYSEEEKTNLAEMKNSYYVESLKSLNETHILPGVMQVINKMKKMGIKIAIGSSSKNTKRILKQIKLDKTFDAIADGDDVTHGKPAPDIFLVAATKLGVEDHACLVVEDSVSGIIAAKRAGMFAFAIGDARKSPEADYKAEDIKELIEVIKNSR